MISKRFIFWIASLTLVAIGLFGYLTQMEVYRKVIVVNEGDGSKLRPGAKWSGHLGTTCEGPEGRWCN
jgi:hypothetical protein